MSTSKSVGLDVERLRKDMAAPEITDEIIANFNLARALRISQTPGFIVGAHRFSKDCCYGAPKLGRVSHILSRVVPAKRLVSDVRFGSVQSVGRKFRPADRTRSFPRKLGKPPLEPASYLQ